MEVLDKATSPIIFKSVQTIRVVSGKQLSSGSSDRSPVSSSSVSSPMLSSESSEDPLQQAIYGGRRKESTIYAIERNSRFYLGLRKEVYILVKFVSKKNVCLMYIY